MIVEDQALIALSLEAYLEDMGIDVCEPLSSGTQALAWLASHTPSVAILDYTLKDGPCLRLIRALQGRGIPFLIYSGPQAGCGSGEASERAPGSPSPVIAPPSWQL
jgi:DNA-binding NarL/FixJ family response regulator